jgi:hypothetical protein
VPAALHGTCLVTAANPVWQDTFALCGGRCCCSCCCCCGKGCSAMQPTLCLGAVQHKHAHLAWLCVLHASSGAAASRITPSPFAFKAPPSRACSSLLQGLTVPACTDHLVHLSFQIFDLENTHECAWPAALQQLVATCPTHTQARAFRKCARPWFVQCVGACGRVAICMQRALCQLVQARHVKPCGLR